MFLGENSTHSNFTLGCAIRKIEKFSYCKVNVRFWYINMKNPLRRLSHTIEFTLNERVCTLLYIDVQFGTVNQGLMPEL